jgi:Na+(H+)/acetate symporter ActP
MAMHFLVAKYLQKDANMTSAAYISERWRLTNEKYWQSAHSTVRVVGAILSEGMAGCTDEDIME